MKKKCLSIILTVSLIISGVVILPVTAEVTTGVYENSDMTVLIPCEEKSEASWVTNGVDTTLSQETLSPDGKNLGININAGGEAMFAATPQTGVTGIEGFAFWVKTPNVPGFYFVLQADNAGRHYQFTGTTSQLATYYTIDKNGIFAEHQIDWKNFSLVNFEGFVIVPNAGFKYNWGGTETPFNPAELSGIGVYTDAYASQSMSIDDIGYYTDFANFKSSHEGKNFGGDFENNDMKVLVPCESKTEASWVTNGADATLTQESLSPDGKNFGINIGAGGEAMFGATPQTGVSGIEGFAFWVKTPNSPGFYFVLQADNGGHHYQFTGTSSQLETYYTIDKNGVFAEHQIDWKNFSLVDFEGFVIVPNAGFKFNWGGAETAFQPNELSGIGIYTDAYAGKSMSIDDIGYYTNLDAFKASHVGKSFSGKSNLIQLLSEAQIAFEKGELFYTGGWSEFVTAYYEALSVRDSANSTEVEISDAIDNLSASLNGLEVTVDRTELIQLLDDSKADYDLGSIWYNTGWDDFSSAYTEAGNTNSNINSTQEEIELAIAALSLAKSALVLKYENRVELEKMLLEDGTATVIFDSGSSAYSSGWNEFVSAYNEACEIILDTEATDSQIDSALNSLELSIDELKAVQFNESTTENKEMTVVNDGSNNEQIAYNNGRVVIDSSIASPDGKAYEIAVKPVTENSNVIDISFNVMYPYDFDVDTAQGFVFWFKAPQGATAPWLNFDVHCDTMHFGLNELEFFMVNKDGTFLEKQGKAILSPDFEGWVIVPASSIKFNWGSGGSQTFNMNNATSVGFNSAPDEEGGSAGKSFIVDDFSVYTDLDKLKTALGVVSDVVTVTPTEEAKPDNTKQEANESWIIDSNTANYDSGYGSVLNLKENDTVTIRGIDFGTGTSNKISVKLNVISIGTVNIYKLGANGVKTLIGKIQAGETTFEATNFLANLSANISGTNDIQFEFTNGFQGDMMAFEFMRSVSSNPDTGDLSHMFLFLMLAMAGILLYKTRSKKIQHLIK